MKKFFSTLFGIIMVIAFSPFILLILLIYGVFLFICFIKEYPKYRKSLFFKNSKLKYSHSLYISDYYKIYDDVYKYNDSISLIRKNKYILYYKGKNSYFFRDCPIFFKIENEELYISLDGDPFIKFNDWFKNLQFERTLNKYLLIFEEETVDEYGESVNLSQFSNIIIGKDYSNIAEKINEKENNT